MVKRSTKQYEVDFVCNRGSHRYYNQFAFSIPDEAKMRQEHKSLIYTGDLFKKIFVVKLYQALAQ